MTRDTTRQYVNLLAALFALTVNILSNALPLNGLNTGDISDRFQVYFVPAGYVFSIWGVIYIGWIAFILFQIRRSRKESPRLRRLGYWFALSCVFNAAWLFCWHYELFGLSVLVMLAPYCMIHYYKPMPEALGSIGAGLLLGLLSWRTGTIVYGWFLHYAVALSMDLLSLSQSGRL